MRGQLDAMSTNTLFTGEDLWKIVADGSRYELSRGELVPMTPVGIRHAVVVSKIGRLLGNFVEKNSLGIVGLDGGFYLRRNPDTLRAPDMAFISKERIAREGIPEKFADSPPGLAIEVLSLEDTVTDMQKKVEEYLTGGVPLVWIIDPANQRVTVYRDLQDVKVLTHDQELDGGHVLPGFRIKVGDIFAV
jgi:Uma2 family endonuclease